MIPGSGSSIEATEVPLTAHSPSSWQYASMSIERFESVLHIHAFLRAHKPVPDIYIDAFTIDYDAGQLSDLDGSFLILLESSNSRYLIIFNLSPAAHPHGMYMHSISPPV